MTAEPPRLKTPASPALRVAVVAFDGISPFHLAVPCVVFGEQHPQFPPITLKVCAAETGALRSTAGFDIGVHHTLAALKSADIVIVPSWHDVAVKPPASLCKALVKALVKAQARGATVVGLCLGAYALAEAGLLDGHRATTHWAYAADFAARYPRVTFDAAVLYVADGNVVTAAGTVAGIDCCLSLLRQRFGAAVANSVARRLVVAPHRQGGQTQFIEQPVPVSPTDTRLAALLDWLQANLHLPHSVDTVAARAMLSRRSFTRQFRQLTGLSFVAWLLAARLAHAQRLLEATALPIERVAEQAGFGSVASLRLYFKREFGLSPSLWRQQFRD